MLSTQVSCGRLSIIVGTASDEVLLATFDLTIREEYLLAGDAVGKMSLSWSPLRWSNGSTAKCDPIHRSRCWA
jgi:hypothetical protein